MDANEDFEAELSFYSLQYTLEGHKSTRVINDLESAIFSHENQVIWCAKFSPSGQSIAGAGQGIITVWDAAGKVGSKLVTKNSIGIPEVDWSKDGSRLVSAGDHVKIWDVKTEKCVKNLREEFFVCSAKFSPDDSLILSGYEDCSARMWNAETGACLNTFMRCKGSVVAVDFHHDRARFMMTSKRGDCYMYDLRSMEIVEDLTSLAEDRAIVSAKFVRNSIYILFSMRDYSLRLYDIRKQEAVGIYKGYINNRASCRNFLLTTSGKYIVCGSFDQLIYIWDVNTQELVQVLAGHSDQVESVDCHPENDNIVSSSIDNSIKIWKNS